MKEKQKEIYNGLKSKDEKTRLGSRETQPIKTLLS